MKKLCRLVLIILIIALTSALWGCFAPRQQTHSDAFLAMGTTIAVSLTATEKDAQLHFAQLREIARRYDAAFSAGEASSQLHKFNANVTQSLELSGDLAAVIILAFELHTLTNGAFDPTLRPLIELWDIKISTAPPSGGEIEQALAHCGIDKFNLVSEGDKLTVTKNDPAAGLDLGAIAKGALLDAMMGYLDGNVSGALLSIGGSSVGALGTKSGGVPYRVGVRNPENTSENYMALDLSEGKTLSVSGNYQQYFEHGGAIYHHIMNPSTGQPAEAVGFQSVAAVLPRGHNSGAIGDALSTAFFVMGEAAARELIASGALGEGIDIYFYR